MQAHAKLAERLNSQQQAAARQQERAQADLRTLQVIRGPTRKSMYACMHVQPATFTCWWQRLAVWCDDTRQPGVLALELTHQLTYAPTAGLVAVTCRQVCRMPTETWMLGPKQLSRKLPEPRQPWCSHHNRWQSGDDPAALTKFMPTYLAMHCISRQ